MTNGAVKSLLDEILEASAHLENAADSALQSAASAEGLGLYRCWRPQKIRDITLPEASVLLVLRGRKHLATTSRSWEAGPGEMLVVPAGTNFWLGNYPDDSGQHYRGIAMRFSDEVISDFRQLYGRELGGGGRHDRWLAEAPLELLHALNQWLVWCGQRPPDSFIARHRRVELLLLLAQAGFAGNLLLPQHPSWSRRITGLFHLDPAHPWRMADVASRLGASESTLRRHLHDEGQGFRSLLEEARLVYGLTLVQESVWSIGRVAEAVGYRSQSRFSERFKRRFGLTPRALRHTQSPDLPLGSLPSSTLGESGESLTD